jgi:hypothetical protein
MKYIVKELDIVATNNVNAPIYNIVGYTDTHLEAYKHYVSGKQYNNKDYKLNTLGSCLSQFRIEEVSPLNTLNKVCDSIGVKSEPIINKISGYQYDIFEVPVSLTDTRPIDYVGKLFKNKDGVFNIPDNIDDVMKSHTWFGNLPIDLHLVIHDTKSYDIEVGDWLIDGSGNIRKYYNGMLVTSAMCKIVRSTNTTLNLPFSQSIMDKLRGTTDAKIIKAAYAAEVNQMEQARSNFNDVLKNLTNTPDVLKNKPAATPTTKKIWTTFEGKDVDMDNIDHQHLSNIYWYTRIFSYTPSQAAIDQLKKRFNGEILEYKPLLKFKFEIRELERKGYLKWQTKGDYLLGIITYDGRNVGSIMKLI